MSKTQRAVTSISTLQRSSPALDADEALRSVRSHIERNFERKVPLGEAADVAGFERTYFSHYFHKKTGVTYIKWVNAMRISRSINLLRDRNLTISEIAEKVGYRDLRTFERNFKRFLDTTPTAFRRGLKG